jgi:hypothetical protein
MDWLTPTREILDFHGSELEPQGHVPLYYKFWDKMKWEKSQNTI